MTTLRIRKRAVEDMDRLWSDIARDSESAADQQFIRIYDSFSSLSDYPESGRLVGGAHPALRMKPVGSYIVFYFPISDGRGIDIVRVLHGARDWPDLLEQPE